MHVGHFLSSHPLSFRSPPRFSPPTPSMPPRNAFREQDTISMSDVFDALGLVL